MQSPKNSVIRLAIVQRRLPHYRLPLYQRIYDYRPQTELTLFCGPSGDKGGGGLAIAGGDPIFVKRVKNWYINIGSKTVTFQPKTIVKAFNPKYKIVILEGSMYFLSNPVILMLRRIVGQKTIIWLKGWPKSHLDTGLQKLLKKFMLRGADGYIVYGEAGRKSLAKYGVKDDLITVAQNTVEVNHFLVDSGKDKGMNNVSSEVLEIINHQSLYIFNIGRLVPKKQVDDLLEAYRLLMEVKNQSINLSLVIAGTGPERERLTKKAKNQHTNGIHFLGAVSDVDAIALFRHSTLCVFPGAVGLAMNQAMACGKTVICADEPGADTELLIHMKNGIRYPPGDVNAIQRYIEDMLEKDDLRKKLGMNARQTIAEKATMDKMAASFLTAINRVNEIKT